MKLEEKDYIIIKNSSNWATRSLSKLRLMFDKAFGNEIKSLLGKSLNINSELKKSLDFFVSGGGFIFNKESKTLNDHEAITSFIICGNIFNSIINHLSVITIPNLNKIGIEITSDDLLSKIEEDDKSKKKFKKEEAIANLESNLEDLHNVAVVDGISENESFLLMQTRNQLMKFMEESIEKMNGLEKEEDVKQIYNNTLKAYNLFIEEYKDKIQALASDFYSSIIKTANSIEEVTSYYLISLGEYSKVTTPMKEKMLAIKNFIGYGGDESIYSLRLDCINYTKTLLKASSKMIDEIESSIKIKDPKDKWVEIIKSCNDFSYEYNKYRFSYIEMYSILKIKLKQDKLKQKKDKKNTIQDAVLKDFIEHSWVDMPARIDKRFPIAELVKVL